MLFGVFYTGNYFIATSTLGIGGWWVLLIDVNLIMCAYVPWSHDCLHTACHVCLGEGTLCKQALNIVRTAETLVFCVENHMTWGVLNWDTIISLRFHACDLRVYGLFRCVSHCV